MGFPLFSIAISDRSYRGEYNVHALNWNSGWRCQITGVLAMLSAEVSIATLTCISVERYLVVTKPLQYHQIKRKHALVAVLTAWLLCLLMAVIPVLTMKPAYSFYGSNGVCFPLHIQSPFMPGWQWSAVIFLGFNVIALAITAICHFAMFFDLRRPQIVGKGRKNEAILARRFCWIIAAEVLCTAPIIICKLLAFSGVLLPGDYLI